MRLGISSWTFTWNVGVEGYSPEQPLRVADLLDRAAILGVKVLQVADNLPLHCLPAEEKVAFSQKAKDLGVQLEVGTRGIQEENLERYLALALQLGSPILRVVIDAPGFRPEPADVVTLLKGVMPAFEERGVCLAIENHDRFKARTLAEIIEKVGSASVGICLDTVNSFGALEGPEVVVPTLAPYTVNLHLKDFVIARSQHMMGFEISGCPLGEGRLEVGWLLEMLDRSHRDPNAILELWTPAAETLAATCAREAAWAERSVRNARRWILD
ncbi:MAG TPA: TIM barrel protein [Anaerolineaceae bacterium]